MFRYAMGAAAITLAGACLSVGLLTPDVAQAQRVKTGILNCDVSAGLGLIIGSQKSVNCLFTPDVPGPQEGYVGSITKFGLDVGVTAGGQMAWAVYAPTSGGYGALAGDYAGATGEMTVAAGLGANVLVGGSNQTVALQPLSIGGQVGLNLAVGVADLHLRPAR
jgi:hypothetical protein